MHAASEACSSSVGMDAAVTPQDKPTMTLNLSNKDDPELMKSQVVEMFGRALGLEKDEQSTESPDSSHVDHW